MTNRPRIRMSPGLKGPQSPVRTLVQPRSLVGRRLWTSNPGSRGSIRRPAPRHPRCRRPTAWFRRSCQIGSRSRAWPNWRLYLRARRHGRRSRWLCRWKPVQRRRTRFPLLAGGAPTTAPRGQRWAGHSAQARRPRRREVRRWAQAAPASNEHADRMAETNELRIFGTSPFPSYRSSTIKPPISRPRKSGRMQGVILSSELPAIPIAR